MKTSNIRTARGAIASSAAVESLEPRSLFSAPYDFSAVGVRFDANAGPSVFEMVGAMAADGGVTGTQTLAALAGSAQSGPLDWATIDMLARGRASVATRPGVAAYSSQSADNFVTDLGYSFGSLLGQFENDGPTDVAFMLQRVEDRLISWYSGRSYEFQYLEITSSGFSIHAGSFSIDSPGVVSWSNSANGADPFTINVSSQDAFGSLVLADGRRIHTSPAFEPSDFGPTYYPGNVSIIVDTDNSDGTIGIGIAREMFEDLGTPHRVGYPNAHGVHGVYRTTVLTGGPLAEQFFGSTDLAGGDGIAAARLAIHLDFTGEYRIYDLGAYDAGDRTVLASGTWNYSTNDSFADRRANVVLTDAGGAKAYFNMTSGFVLSPYLVADATDQNREYILGSGTTMTPLAIDRYVSGGHVSLDDNGHPIFYESATQNVYTEDAVNVWRSQDLIELWGGKPLVSVDSVVEDQGPQIFVLGVAADGDVQAWERDPNGRWMYRNLTQELAASGIVSDVVIFEHRAYWSGTVPVLAVTTLAIAGKNADGELVLYTPILDYNDFGVHSWTFTNITTDGLEPFDQETPVWTGAIQGYLTSWDGLNIVGLDTNGDLVVVWTAPDLEGWRTTNVSDLAGTPAMIGSISVLLTVWDGIHIHALDANGDVYSTWWVPQFGGDWAVNNLTEELNGPAFDTSRNTDRTEAFITFDGDGRSLNIVGFDADGRIRVYWWSPQTNAWLVGDITDSIPLSDAPIGFVAADLMGGTEAPYSYLGQSLYGYNDDGTFSRVWWAPGGPDVWHVDNLSELAIPIPS